MRTFIPSILVCLLGPSLLLAQPPATKKIPVSDTYHGVIVTEDYRWLEDWSDPQVKKWSAAQNSYTRSVLDKLPSAEPIRKQVTEILSAASASYRDLAFRGDSFFAIKQCGIHNDSRCV